MEYFAFGLGSMGPLEWGIILVIVLVIFGAGKLPGLGKSLGSGIRNFNKSVKGGDDEDEKTKELDSGTDEKVERSVRASETVAK
jgi:sec-independent protein translocase protein TatA